MPITLITGPANAGKAQVVLDAVRRDVALGREPLLVLPTRADAEHYLRELAGEGVAMGVSVVRFDGLIEELVALAGVHEPVLGETARAAALAALSREVVGARAGAGFVAALGELLAELQLRRLSPARLRSALESWAASDGAHASATELGRLYEAYEALLAQSGCSDRERRAARALDGIRRRPALWGSRPVLFYGFDDLTPLQADAIETLGAIAGAEVLVALAYEPGRTAFAGRAASFHALAPLAAEHRELEPRSDHYAPAAREALSHLERSLFEADAARVAPDGAVRLLEGGGERAELELVATEAGALLGAGMRAEDIAVVIRPAPARMELLREVFAAAGVPFALDTRRRLRDCAIGAALIGLLRTVPGGGQRDGGEDGGGERSGGERGGGQGGGGQGEGAARDLLAWLRAPGVLEHAELADRFEIELRREGIESAGAARERWERRHWPLDAVERLAEAESGPARARPAALIARAERELLRLFQAPLRGQARVLAGEEADEAGAFLAARGALTELRELARLAPARAPASACELAAVLERVTFAAGDRPEPGAIPVLDPLQLRARRVRALFVCSLQEGEFPAPPRPRPFLSAEERARLAIVTGVRIEDPRDALAAERYLFYAAVSRPEERLYLSWHVADEDGEPCARSLFVDDVCDLFDESLMDERARRALGEVAPGLAAAAAAAPPPAPPAGALSDEQLVRALRERPWSASSLEAWRSCPMRWFVERLLAPETIDPEAEPLARGAVAHQALADTLEALRERTGSAAVTPQRLALARELLARALAEGEAERALTVAGERVQPARRRLQADLERFLEFAAASPSPLEPTHLEIGFGFEEGPSPLPALELADGVRLRGRIDRIDVGEGGVAVVYDYKNRRAPAPVRWLADGNLQVALYMRAAETLLGLDVAGGFYQPLSGESLRARGVLDESSGLGLECTRGDERPAEEVRALLDELLALAVAAAEEAGRGELQSRPRTCGFGEEGCRFPTICRCER